MEVMKTWGQLVAWAAAVVVAVYTVYKGNRELHASTAQRNADLRWKKASAAKELLGDIHKNRWAPTAVQIMDHGSVPCDYEPDAKTKIRINFEGAVKLLGKPQEECNTEEAFVRDCFDWFFFSVDQIQHYIDRNLIEFEDVAPVFKPYAKKLAPNREVHESFMKYHDYDLALKFWRSFPEYVFGESPRSDAEAKRKAAHP
jgi:hypothetical protein